jgi:hypothetical protein
MMNARAREEDAPRAGGANANRPLSAEGGNSFQRESLSFSNARVVALQEEKGVAMRAI